MAELERAEKGERGSKIFAERSASVRNSHSAAEDSESKALQAVETIVVGWNGDDDPQNPKNMPNLKKWTIVAATSMSTFCVGFASSVYSGAIFALTREFETSSEVVILGISLYVLGYALGPLVWGPLSDAYGRKRPLFTALAAFCIFQIPLAVAENMATILISRFIAGTSGSAPFAIVGGLHADFLNPEQNRIAAVVFIGCIFVGPALAPVVGAYLAESHLGWRWTAWITLIISAPCMFLAWLIIPETSAAVLLRRKAAELSKAAKATGPKYVPAQTQHITFRIFMSRYMKAPLQMLVTEPILIILALHVALVYGILYLTLEAFPISFQIDRGWAANTSSLPFLALLLGMILAIVILVAFPAIMRRFKINSRGPENQMMPLMLGAVLLPIGIFWFSGTCSPDINAAPQIVSAVPLGMGILLVFIPGLGYIIETYLTTVNAALAGNACVRALFACAFPLFAPATYTKLGTGWATRLIGFLTVALMPFPFLFFVYGRGLRERSKYAFRYPASST